MFGICKKEKVPTKGCLGYDEAKVCEYCDVYENYRMILIQQYFHWFLVALARPSLDTLLNSYVLIDSSTAKHNTKFFTTKKQLSKH